MRNRTKFLGYVGLWSNKIRSCRVAIGEAWQKWQSRENENGSSLRLVLSTLEFARHVPLFEVNGALGDQVLLGRRRLLIEKALCSPLEPVFLHFIHEFTGKGFVVLRSKVYGVHHLIASPPRVGLSARDPEFLKYSV
jgi:hypothetical protein